MPKQKSHRGAQKRFQVSAKKRIFHKKANKSHILTKKTSTRKRTLGRKAEVSKADRRVVKSMLPYEF